MPFLHEILIYTYHLIVYNKSMELKSNTEFRTLELVTKNIDKINKIFATNDFSQANCEILIAAYANLHNLTANPVYKKCIGDIYYFYFNQKNKALEYYLGYIEKVNNDSSVLFVISSIYSFLNENKLSKKYLELAMNSSFGKINSPIPNSKDLLLGINIGVAAGLSMNDDSSKSLEVYKSIVEYSSEPTDISINIADLELKKANELFRQNKWREASLKYQNIFNQSHLQEADFIKLISTLAQLKQFDIAYEYMKKYEETTQDKVRVNYVIADLLFFQFNKIPESIERFERYLAHNPNDALVCNTLGHLYSKQYDDQFLDKQLDYFNKANELNPNSKVLIKNLALTYSKMGDVKNAKKCYEQILKLNPTNDDLFDYGCFLMNNGDFKNAYNYLPYRFKKETNPALYPPMLPPDKRLNTKSQLKDSIILVQCEQGFGDTIMYSRFAKKISKMASKVIFLVQDELVELFKTSNLGAETHSINTDYSKLEYDYHLSLLDLPMILGTTTKNIPNAKGYLSVDNKKIEHYKYEFIQSKKKFKIGIAYQGNDNFQDLKRDIPLEELIPLMKIKNAEIYILQKENSNSQFDKLPKNLNVINLGKDFFSFDDTATAIMNMDLIISTDNVILNLAGALGKKTFGLFNKYPEYRWFNLKGEDVVWYNSVKPYQVTKTDEWTTLIEKVVSDINDSCLT